MTRDSDLEKWIYKEHTRVKHELLEKYLGGWLPILGRWNDRLLIIDGFAGRGEYVDGSEGSPIILLRKANELLNAGRVTEVICGFVERDPTNFKSLQDAVTSAMGMFPEVRVLEPRNDSFEKVADQIIQTANGKIIPSFWFIDPFGFTGISFETVELIMSLERSEVFITLMLRDIGRFLSHPQLTDTFDGLFGTGDWRHIVQSNQAGAAKERELLELYVAQLQSLGCMVTSFRVCMDEKVQTIYYMVHATNHPKGRRLMKDVMYRQGSEGVFAYMGPQDQMTRLQKTLFQEDPIPELKENLLFSQAGKTMSFEDLRNKCCDDDELRDPDYRKALQELRAEEVIEVRSVTSKTPRGLSGDDLITFPRG